MRKYLAICFLLLLAASNAGGAPALEHSDTFVSRPVTASDGFTWMYGITVADNRTVFRVKDGDVAYETMGALPVGLTGTMVSASNVNPGVIFVLAYDASSNYFLYRSIDYGATLDNVFTFGFGNGTAGANTTSVRMLSPICEITVNYPGQSTGIGDLIFGEYNINGSRSNGSTNDRVRIVRSIDNGATWDNVVEWNSDGSHANITHIHNIVQDNSTGYIYIATGDGDSSSGITRWDGISAWTNNTNLSSINWSGFTVLSGAQKYRTVGMLFDDSYIYTMSDAINDNTNSGIWRAPKDLSSGSTRMYSANITYDNYHVGWWGVKIGNNMVFSTSAEVTDASNKFTHFGDRFYTSSDGANWASSGEVRRTSYNTSSVRPNTFFAHLGKIYFNMGYMSGYYGPMIFTFSGESFTGSSPTVLHPVYYVGDWGSGASDNSLGISKPRSMATIGAAIAGTWMTYGGRFRIQNGNTNETSFSETFGDEALTGVSTYTTTLEGSGSTTINLTSPTNTLTMATNNFSYSKLRICSSVVLSGTNNMISRVGITK